ncbi:MAG: Peptide deformylase [Candidatus Magasanikbacteria bacterium GW2011_GWA2_46_17]|uniref:Peptide deformylase n=1 Tax=Candidatus Magasanikbacteria bacterium GW2011_GWA2_46_17 TaxID=1619042 RepID=A0A0G1NZ22_9BACT|nr:MAG: Peptide deformylase [Candidatus Magasanikbacteria bacterium GW2011_GWA2_46_17]
MTKIVQNGEAVLREIAKEVPVNEITSPKIAAILGRMKKALDSQEDGVAIAAPQIGVSLRIFLVSERTFDLPDDVGERRKQVKDRSKKYGHLIFINPVITKISKDKAFLEEGCLSVRYKYGKIERAVKATVMAFDEHGKKFTRGGSGLLAQIFQHETDHLEGVLFIDKAVDVKDLPPKEVGKNS